jgi:formylglycine-generating enzyme required for sulfatase activity
VAVATCCCAVAGAVLRPSVADEPAASPPATAVRQGRLHAQQRQWAAAIDEFNRALEENPENASAHWFRAQALAQLGRRAAARADYEQVVQLVDSPQDAKALRYRGEAFLRLGRFEEALRDLNAALKLSPDDAPALMCRGDALAGLSRYDEAINEFTAALKLRPRSADAYLRRGNALVRGGNERAGVADHKRALRLGGMVAGELIIRDADSAAELRFVFVPPAAHWVGYTEEERLAAAAESRQLLFGHNATPRREVRLEQGFFILDREITQAQFDAFAPRETPDAGPPPRPREDVIRLAPREPSTAADPRDSPLPSAEKLDPAEREASGHQPKSQVSWNEAAAWCAQLQRRLGIAVRLPAEIEWECAARQEADWVYPWGDEGFHAWSEQADDGAARPLDEAANGDVTPSGVYDLGGNLSEWCYDEYQNELFVEPAGVHAHHPASVL